MRRTFLLLVGALLLALTACAPSADPAGTAPAATPSAPAQQAPTPAPDLPESTPAPEPNPPSAVTLTITVGERQFSATLADNESARQLAALLPLTLDMRELNGNEKYFYLDSTLPTDAYSPGQIHTGDLMLYGDSCLVLFYQSFSSGYSYTPLGQVDNPDGLADALGSGNVTVSFSTGS